MITTDMLHGIAQVGRCFNLATKDNKANDRFYKVVELLQLLLPSIGYSITNYYPDTYSGEFNIRVKSVDLSTIYGEDNE